MIEREKHILTTYHFLLPYIGKYPQMLELSICLHLQEQKNKTFFCFFLNIVRIEYVYFIGTELA